MKISIVLFLYNRPKDSARIIDLLVKSRLDSKNIDLLCYIDGPGNEEDEKSQQEIFEIINQVRLFHNNFFIIQRSYNLGLKSNIISALNDVFKTYEAAIILEDDLVFTEGFIDFMIQALQYYKDDFTIGSVSGYNYYDKTFESNLIISNYADCLGWGTWRSRWPKNVLDQNHRNINRKDFNRNNSYPYFEMLKRQKRIKDSWAIHWYAFNFLQKRSMIFSGKNLILHDPIGNSTNHQVDHDKDPLWKNPEEELSNNYIAVFEKSKLIDGDGYLENFLKKYPLSKIRRFLLKF